MFQYAAIAHAKPTKKIRDLMREMMGDMLGKIETPGMTQEMSIEPDAETIGSHSIDLIKVKQEFDANLDPTGMQTKMQEIMFGARWHGLTRRLHGWLLRTDDGRRP